MKKLLFACAGLAALTAAARPSVDPDKVKVGMDERHNVLVEYELAGSPAVVTVEFQTNTLAQGAGEWVKLGGDVVRTVRGDVNCLVRTTGAHSFVWKAARDWRDRYIADQRTADLARLRAGEEGRRPLLRGPRLHPGRALERPLQDALSADAQVSRSRRDVGDGRRSRLEQRDGS